MGIKANFTDDIQNPFTIYHTTYRFHVHIYIHFHIDLIMEGIRMCHVPLDSNMVGYFSEIKHSETTK